MKWVRGGFLLIVSISGFVGLYGSAGEGPPRIDQTGITVPDPVLVIPGPVVSINDRGVGLAAYAQNGQVIVRRFGGVTGFSEPETVGTDVEENDIDAVVGGTRARVAWRGRDGRVSVLNGSMDTGTWDTQIDVATTGAADPLFANGQHSSIGRTFVSWRASVVGTGGQPVTRGFGTVSLVAPHSLLSRYAEEEGIAAVFDLSTATGGSSSIAVWTAGSARTNSSLAHVYVSIGNGGTWGVAQSLAAVTGGVGAPAIDMDENGNAMLVWPQSDGVFLRRYVVSSNTWTPPTIVKSETSIVRDLRIDVAPNGQAIVAWAGGSGGGLWSAIGNVNSDAWSDLQRLDFDGETALNGGEPRVAIDLLGRALVVWRAENRLYASEHHADGWRPGAPLGPTQSAADLDLNDAGLGVAVWWNDGLQSRIWNAPGPLVASFTYSPDPGVAGLGILFDAQESAGPFPVTSFDWDWENTGTFDEDRGAAPSRIFETPGTYTTRLRITDSAGQMAETTRSVNVVGVGEVSSQVIVNYRGPGDGLLEIQSTQPGFAPVRCSTSTPPGQPTDTGTCSAIVLAGYDITIVAEYDPVRSIFSGWPEGFRQCRELVTSTTDGITRAECRFTALSIDRAFDVTFQIAAPTTDILRVQLHQFSFGGGEIFSLPSIVHCIVENQLIRSSTGGNCSYSIAPGTTLTLMAVPASGGSRFVGWQGCDSQPSQTECTVTMNGLRTVTAQFGGG
jgi:PKD repeat protein